MLVLITYDVNTQTAAGVRRLARVAKICTNYGQRVQNSVFECIVDQTQYVMLKKQLKDIIDVDKDSVRYYVMGEKYKSKVEHIGVQRAMIEGIDAALNRFRVLVNEQLHSRIAR